MPPPPGPEGSLHRWYREAAELEAQADRVVHRTYGMGGLTYVGSRDDCEAPEGFGTTLVGEDVCDPYVGDWQDGMPQGLGLLVIGGVEPYAWCHGMFACQGRGAALSAIRSWPP